jgi:hypothetical protein
VVDSTWKNVGRTLALMAFTFLKGQHGFGLHFTNSTFQESHGRRDVLDATQVLGNRPEIAFKHACSVKVTEAPL